MISGRLTKPSNLRARSGSGRAARRWTAVALAAAVTASGAVLLGGAGPAASAAALSTFTKTGTDVTNNSTADSTDPSHPGAGKPGDTVNWVLHYANQTGSAANVSVTDQITGGQTYTGGSLKVPPGWTGGVSGSTLTASGPAQSPTTSVASASFAPTTPFTTQGGDGYSASGFGGNVYNVFHHNHSDHTVFCATLQNAVCPGWPAQSTWVSTVAGTPVGQVPAGVPSDLGAWTTAQVNGSFINQTTGRLYWPISSIAQDANHNFIFGTQCLDLTTATSCGFTQIGTTKVVAQYAFGGDGIPAADGNRYYLDNNGFMDCITPNGTFCGSTDIAGGPIGSAGGQEVGTYGRYVYVSYIDPGTGTAASQSDFLACYDTSTHALCPGFPKKVGAAENNNGAGASEILPVVSSTGTFLGACAVFNNVCLKPDGTQISNPWSQIRYGYIPSVVGFSTGVLIGTKYYTPNGPDSTNNLTTGVDACYDFSRPLVGGKVQPCANFTPPHNLRGYTVRALANLPGCMVGSGDGAQITLFSAVDGGPCTGAADTVSATPQDWYCDGQSTHATTWDTLTLVGLTPGSYTSATLTLLDKNGAAVPGWTGRPIASGATSIDLSSIPVSGTTTSLTAVVALMGVTGSVNNAHLQLSWKGDPIQVCYSTVLPQVPCVDGAATASVSNTATAITTGSSTTDSPGGVSTGPATFTVTDATKACGLIFTKTAAQQRAAPGDQIDYTITVKNPTASTVTGATFTDNLGGVLDDATYNNDANAIPIGKAVTTTVANNLVLTWTGDLPPGTSTSITYSVTVNNPDTGDKQLANTVVSPNPSNCKSGSTDPACSVTVPVQVRGLHVVKSSTATSVKPGDKVPYTITITNTGNVDYTAAQPASFSDTLTSVPADASYDNDASDGGVGTVTYTEPTISWVGPLAGGAMATITYSVTVNDPYSGNGKLDNVVVTPPGEGGNCDTGSTDPACAVHVPVVPTPPVTTPPVTTPPVTTPPVTTPPVTTPPVTTPPVTTHSTTPVPTHSKPTTPTLPPTFREGTSLAWTGAPMLTLFALAGLLLGAGALMLLSGRTHRRTH
jgi:uncharacterized repeat protein (TIGR01451 family)